MATTTWYFLQNNSVDFTSSVLSANISQGREKYLDTYGGGSISITINNNTGLADTFLFNDKLFVSTNGTSSTQYADLFAVQQVTYNDYPGDTGLSTATIFAVDALARSGRVQATDFALTQAATTAQMKQFNSSVLPSDIKVFNAFGNDGDSIASAQTYTGTALNQFNILQTTERGVLRTKYPSVVGRVTQYIYAYSRSEIGQAFDSSFNFGRSASSTVIAYQTFDRMQNGTSFINTATISPLGLSTETRTNAAAVTTYGPAFYSSSTVDYTATQAQGNGDWIVNTFSNPTDLRYKISFSDKAQNQTAYTLMLHNFGADLAFNLEFKPPSSASTLSDQVVLEGWQINMTPEQTVWSLFFSPLNYYQFFTLNSGTLGILGGGNITYEQPEITYDERNWVYNDSNADDTASRLGW